MKKCILLESLCLAACFPAYASDFLDHVNPKPLVMMQSQAVAPEFNASSQQTASQNVNIEQKRNPVSTAASSVSNTTADCRYLQSNSTQLFGFGGSNTSMLRDLVCVLGKPLNDEQKIALCIESPEYRKVREQAGNPCK
jgi:hypothetical protein